MKRGRRTWIRRHDSEGISLPEECPGCKSGQAKTNTSICESRIEIAAFCFAEWRSGVPVEDTLNENDCTSNSRLIAHVCSVGWGQVEGQMILTAVHPILAQLIPEDSCTICLSVMNVRAPRLGNVNVDQTAFLLFRASQALLFS